MPKTHEITIVGGGVAGLALAAALDPELWRVTIFEQREKLPTVESAMGMWPIAQKALAYLGLHDLLNAAVPCKKVVISTADGRPLLALRTNIKLLTRPALAQALTDRLPETVKVEHLRIVDIGDLPGDLVIGADGVHSRVRKWHWGTNAHGLDTWVVRGTAAIPPMVGRLTEWWGEGMLFGMSPNMGDSTNWYATVRQNPGLPAEALEEIRFTHRDYPRAVQRVLAATDPEQAVVHRVFTAPLTTSLVRGRAVLIGDAAHGMTPNVARGACESLVDAVTLAHELNNRGIHDGPKAYQRQRLVRGQGVRVGASLMTAVQQSPTLHKIAGVFGPS
ncbi:FAD-dependent monooxygenase [Granulicoccus phenolivorans]|uniref:FAD-dependent monooxygenase n=1 Tax=Granulicoccus phenolivorans TaxID=266854 RepID=UPI0003FC4B72|nr:FAD-dependent monooxygenase [Granulicoccus phenolivorans]